MNQVKLMKGYQEFLDSFIWDIYITVTFRRVTSAAAALRAFRYFFKRLNVPGQAFFRNYIRCVIFCEKQGYRDGVHIHGLIQGIGKDLAPLLEEKCRRSFGESKVLPYNYELPELASGYLARKCISFSLEHWDYLKINSKHRSKT